MTTYIALLRAVNVGGTGKLPMSELVAMCEACGFARVRTYIANGNVVFDFKGGASHVKALLASRLAAYAGKPVDLSRCTAAGGRTAARHRPTQRSVPARHARDLCALR